MTDNTLVIKSLIKKHLEGSATAQEEAAFIQLWNLYDDEELAQLIEEVNAEMPSPPAENLPKVDAAALARKIVTIAAARKVAQRKRTLVKYAVPIAASVLLVVGLWMNKVLSERQQYKVICGASIEAGDINTTEFNCTIKDGEKNYLVDSNTSLQLRYNGLRIIQRPGKIVYQQHNGTDDTIRFRGHEISTASEQQYLVVLPGNTVLRLNAQTKLKIAPDPSTGTLTASLMQGEVFAESQGALTMTGPNVNITSQGGSFDLRAIEGGSLIAVSKGRLEASFPSGNSETLNFSDWSAFVKIKDKEIIKDSIMTQRCEDIEGFTVWKNTERVYENVPLAVFVDQMQYWYGVRFTDLKCLDKEKRVTTRLCYKATREDFFAVLRHNGFKVYTTSSGYTFCNPEREKKEQIVARQ
ncbi:FecR domain-containing protein [Niabella beijingensis]|uniref:FecR domain-containing protein n=1 Tax=Niabella beijingensis TaxID=2872700 RepID=UPI001CBC0950|nr:FecR family protein [Niabella beijingensis]MBZ4190562.1 FecR family protein [Niabella beijingensis]